MGVMQVQCTDCGEYADVVGDIIDDTTMHQLARRGHPDGRLLHFVCDPCEGNLQPVEGP